MWLYQVMQQNLNIPVLGPEEPAISRIEYIMNNNYKIPVNTSVVYKKTIQKMLNSFDAVAQYRAIKVSVNVDFIKTFMRMIMLLQDPFYGLREF
jgi:primosomal protein N' (replication factor Y)